MPPQQQLTFHERILHQQLILGVDPPMVTQHAEQITCGNNGPWPEKLHVDWVVPASQQKAALQRQKKKLLLLH